MFVCLTQSEVFERHPRTMIDKIPEVKINRYDLLREQHRELCQANSNDVPGLKKIGNNSKKRPNR